MLVAVLLVYAAAATGATSILLLSVALECAARRWPCRGAALLLLGLASAWGAWWLGYQAGAGR